MHEVSGSLIGVQGLHSACDWITSITQVKWVHYSFPHYLLAIAHHALHALCYEITHFCEFAARFLLLHGLVRCWSARVPGLFTYCSFKAAGVSIKMFFFTLQIMILFFLTLLLFLTFPDVISHSEMIKTLLPPCCLLDIIHAFLQPLEDLHEGEIFITEIYAKS